MHSLLEAYLQQVAAHLSALPVKRRNEELHEMRQHLLNAVTVNQELGQSEEDAAANAVLQFGTPEDLGGNLIWAWRRGEKKLNKRSFWLAAACTLAILFFMPLLAVALPFGPWFPTTAGVSSPLIAGAICGGLLSKRGLAGTTLGTTLYYYVFGASVFVYSYSQPEFRHLMEPVSRTVGLFFVQQSEAALLTLFVAWAVNRWRMKRTERLRSAKN